ncbi:MAG: RNA 2',3'-cyclic phosphodiesterase [Acidobacteria bacterium]|nr:RNA 2',3'-cyclic phosphodiesterase [Acidobacteriota bacterium]MCI0719257.1 RNA 2',3'-cyclic phosphodiesterase [Acidobacteriota bacterium]
MPHAATTRTFVCIELPASIRAQAEELQHRLSGLSAEVSWVRRSNLHLTLKFLGEISQPQVESACSAVEQAAAGVDAFFIRLSGAGCFPSSRNPRVLWIGLSEASPAPLFEAVDRELFRAGFPRETRSFSPHLTLGRIRSNRKATRLGKVFSAAEFDTPPFLVSEVTVMKSELKSSGAVYTPIARLRLQNRKVQAG